MTLNRTGIFTFEEAKAAYKNVDSKCQVDSDCPYDLICLYTDFCYFPFYCREGDITRCIDRDNLTKYEGACTTNEDCLSLNCSNNTCVGRHYEASIGKNYQKYGLEYHETCTKHDECYEKNCKDGICERYDLGRNINNFLFKASIGGLVVIVLLVILCCFCCRRRKRSC